MNLQNSFSQLFKSFCLPKACILSLLTQQVLLLALAASLDDIKDTNYSILMAHISSLLMVKINSVAEMQLHLGLIGRNNSFCARWVNNCLPVGGIYQPLTPALTKACSSISPWKPLLKVVLLITGWLPMAICGAKMAGTILSAEILGQSTHWPKPTQWQLQGPGSISTNQSPSAWSEN